MPDIDRRLDVAFHPSTMPEVPECSRCRSAADVEWIGQVPSSEASWFTCRHCSSTWPVYLHQGAPVRSRSSRNR